MTRKEMIIRAAELKVEVIKKETPFGNQNINSWIGFFSRESNKSLRESIENLEKHISE